MESLTSQKPYLLRAMYQWMVDNQLVPHIVIADPAAKGHVSGVPAHLLADEHLTLNISPTATQALVIHDEFVEFHARFAGQSHHVFVAVAAIVAIYDRDFQQGLSLPLEALPDTPAEPGANADDSGEKSADKTDKRKPSHLKIVK
ncbi:MAG: ClpXP protease specificity-enhancing factor SspB [Cardiobacteriaceae bacterium]|nr:ClpXP protease specificity-enhancing factor SspB [Cardiobacteriaceae bacterium]